VQGVLHQSQTRLNFISPADPPLSADRPRLDQWFRVDIPRIQQQVPYSLLPVYLEQGQPNLSSLPPVSTSVALPRPDIQIDLSDGPHLSYAIQWFSFAVILLAGYVTFFVRQTSK
jgi:surfeit locus 1 family protein